MYRQRVSFGGVMTKTVGAIIALNVVFFIAQLAYEPLTPALALVTDDVFPGRLYTLFTYSFLHGGVGHILFNMLSLYFFAGSLQLYIGVRRFLVLYAGSAVAGGLLSLAFYSTGETVVGASAAILGVLTAYAIYFPSSKVLLFFVIPLPVRHFIYLLMAVSVYYSVFGGGGNIAHLAHLGGIVFAFVYCNRYWNLRKLWEEMRYRSRRRKFKVIQ